MLSPLEARNPNLKMGFYYTYFYILDCFFSFSFLNTFSFVTTYIFEYLIHAFSPTKNVMAPTPKLFELGHAM